MMPASLCKSVSNFSGTIGQNAQKFEALFRLLFLNDACFASNAICK